MYEQFLKLADIDITKEPMEVAPTIHYAMGGIRTVAESGASTNLPGLYAAGEVAGGLHGANRLGGNSLSDLVVFGARAGFYAAQYAQGVVEQPNVDPAQVEQEVQTLEAPLKNPGVGNPYKVMADLQDAMQDGAGIAKTEELLQKCLASVLDLQSRAQRVHVEGAKAYNPGWHTARDVRFLTRLAEAIVRCAIERKESRGGHWRLDHLDRVDEFGKVNLVVKKGPNGEMQVRREPIPPIPEYLGSLMDKIKPPEYAKIMKQQGVKA
jgi:succinate dehydrogenase / fumarate reductase flavoprotein subunit